MISVTGKAQAHHQALGNHPTGKLGHREGLHHDGLTGLSGLERRLNLSMQFTPMLDPLSQALTKHGNPTSFTKRLFSSSRRSSIPMVDE